VLQDQDQHHTEHMVEMVEHHRSDHFVQQLVVAVEDTLMVLVKQ
jgi:hypothetical protein